MCDIKDAQRHEELARIQEIENDIVSSRKNYLEATGIYALISEINKDNNILNKANECYKKAKELSGENVNGNLSTKELAKKTIEELKTETGPCAKKNIMTQIMLAKKYEKTSPDISCKKYLEAAEMLIKES
jgi:hypothetical protein